MRVLSLVKSSLNSLRKPSSSSEVPEASADLKRGSVHETPPGEFPKGPKPSACLIVTFHLSKILTLVGIILVVRALLVDKDYEQLKTFGAGLCLSTVGIALLIITSVLTSKETESMTGHLEQQLNEEYRKFKDNRPLLEDEEENISRPAPSIIIKSTHLV